MASRATTRWLGLGLLIGAAFVARPSSAETPKPAGKPAAADKAAAPPKPAAAPAKKKLGPPPDKATSAKVNAYIELMNAESNNLFSLRSSLFRNIDPKVGPTCKESVELPYSGQPYESKYDEYRKRLKAKPAMKTDAAALKMVDAVEGVWKLGKEPGPRSSYQGKSNPDEWCKRLKEMFPRYVAFFDQYSQGNREISAFVDTFTEDRDLREVDAAEKKYGKNYRYAFARLTVEGKILMRTVREEIGKEAPSAAVLRERFATYLAIGDETQARMKKDPKGSGYVYPTNFSFFLGESTPKLKRAGDDLIALLEAKPTKDFGDRLDSKWGALVNAYNEIIRYGNNIEWETKMK